ncbi:RepA leader peptide Tap [Enterococcus gallinarum]|nr:RepA leader peptide Tap [Enterococcus gallinarum]
MPGKVQDFFLCSLLLRIVSAGWCVIQLQHVVK